MILYGLYFVVLAMSVMSALAAAWALAVQLFILSCVIFVGIVLYRMVRRPTHENQDHVHWSQRDKFH